MVKKAIDFVGFGAGAISDELAERIKRIFRSNQEMIWVARRAAYAILEGNVSIDDTTMDVVGLMYQLGYIRKDLDLSTFAINRVYKALLGKRAKTMIPARVHDFYTETNGIDRFRLANIRYETFMPQDGDWSKKVIDSIKELFDDQFPAEQPMVYDAVNLRFGLEEESGRTYKQVSAMLHISESTAKSKVRRGLEAINRSGIMWGTMPNGAFAVAPLSITLKSNIDDICLTTPAYYSLKKLRINTIGDALEALKGRGRIRGISDVANRELEQKLIRAGFELK
ncbi:MAG: hypothetical protein K5837_00995 [Candidatus Saccharibacteria bacterium]|nr:hypothetical protein [Candidatus Saccharibacteria bacterium]